MTPEETAILEAVERVRKARRVLDDACEKHRAANQAAYDASKQRDEANTEFNRAQAALWEAAAGDGRPSGLSWLWGDTKPEEAADEVKADA